MTDPKRFTIDPSVLSNLAIESMLQAKAPTQAPSDSPSRPAFPSGPEPARVYGYVTFVDPTTGVEHLLHDADNPDMTVGYPGAITLRFVNPAGDTQDLVLGPSHVHYKEARRLPNGTVDYPGVNQAGSVAWYYDIQLNPDQTEGAPRFGGPSSVALAYPRTAMVSYNPDQWRFLDIVHLGDWSSTVNPDGTYSSAAFSRRATPFPDLPDSP